MRIQGGLRVKKLTVQTKYNYIDESTRKYSGHFDC